MKVIILFFLTILSFNGFSQTEKVLKTAQISPNCYYEINDNKLFTVEKGWSYYIYRIIDLNQKKQIAYKQFDSESKYVLNKTGLFYIEKKGNSYYEYHFIDFNGNENVSATEIAYTIPMILENEFIYTSSLNDFYYFTYENPKYCVYKTSGYASSEIKIFEGSEKIVFLENLNNDILITTYDGVNYNLYKYDAVLGTTTLFKSISAILPLEISLSNKNENNIFLNFVNDSSKFIYKTDLTNAESQIFINNKIGKLNFINNNKFVLKEDSVSLSNPYLIANKNTPNSFKTLTIKNTNNPVIPKVEERFGGEHFLLSHFDNGYEMGYVNNQDSIEYVSDLVKGYGSSFCLKNYSSSLNSQKIIPFLRLNDSTVLIIQTNGNDDFYYVYKTVNNEQTSLFKIDNPLNVKKFFIDKANNTIYWLESQGYYASDSSLLYRRKLDDIDSQQPSVKPQKETWFKQIATTRNNNFFDASGTLKTKPKDIKIDKNNNVYTYFTFYYISTPVQNVSVFSTDSNSYLNLKTRHVFTKFDKFGNQKWVTSLGEKSSVSWFDYEFEIDSDNNVIILGYYFETGYFDDDSLTSPRACFFITKLNGETGKVIWKKKIAETYYTDDIFIDAMTLDEDDNIYLAFMYPNFGIQIQNQSLSADLSMANAVAKFSPEGSVEWLKNINTPWTDNYGFSYIFNNNENNTLTICQTKGTAREQFIQTLDLEGNIIDTNSISTTGFSRLLVGMNNSNNQLFGLGFYNKQLEFERYKLSTTETKNFSFLYDHKKSEPISFKNGINTLFYPIDISYYNNEFYVYGTIRSNSVSKELVLVKFDSIGNFIAYRNINQKISNDDVKLNSFVVDGDYIILLGSDFNLDSENGVVPLITSNRSVSVLKIKNEGWIEDEDWFEQINAFIRPEDNDVLIYPNPFINEFEIIFSNYNVDFQSYIIYNSNGTIVSEGSLNEIQFQKVAFEEFSAGTYIIQFIGVDKVVTKKIIKINN